MKFHLSNLLGQLSWYSTAGAPGIGATCTGALIHDTHEPALREKRNHSKKLCISEAYIESKELLWMLPVMDMASLAHCHGRQLYNTN